MNVSPEALAHIREHFPLTPVPGVPEIRIHKASPESGIWRLGEIAGAELSAPYWSSWWGGGIALARHVLDHPDIVDGKRVLDLGCGSGLVGIAAAKSGAGDVIALDADPFAIAVAQMSAEANGVMLAAQLHDMRTEAAPNADVVLAGDVFYDAELAAHALSYLQRCAARGLRILIGDPDRAHLPAAHLKRIASYDGADFASPRARVSVFALA